MRERRAFPRVRSLFRGNEHAKRERILVRPDDSDVDFISVTSRSDRHKLPSSFDIARLITALPHSLHKAHRRTSLPSSIPWPAAVAPRHPPRRRRSRKARSFGQSLASWKAGAARGRRPWTRCTTMHWCTCARVSTRPSDGVYGEGLRGQRCGGRACRQGDPPCPKRVSHMHGPSPTCT